ncbi:vegetative incompatibility protein HET-E-1 [Trichoderma camerunense]
MEGLGAAVALTTKIVSLCAEYSSAVKNASHDIQRLRERVGSLETTLKDVSELLKGPHGSRLRTSQKLQDALNSSRSLLGSIATTLENKLNGGRRQRTMRAIGLRALKWPFESKELENNIAALEQYQSTMAVAIQIDQTAEVLTINHKIDLSKLPIAKGAAYNSQANEYDPRCHPRTRLNVLAEIYNWFEDPHGKCIYWLCGMAGTGKSTISRTVAEYLAEKKVPCASFFFKKGEGDRGGATLFFTTIAAQLVQQLPCIVPHVRAAIEADMNISDKTKNEQFEKLILEPLDKCEGQQSTVVSIVIDALDECDLEDDARSMVHLMARAMEVTSVRLRFFITSRPELPIRLGFKGIGNSYKELALHDIPEPDIKKDIAIYLEDELTAIVQRYNLSVETRRQIPPQWPGSQNIEKLVDMAIPLFIYAATACRFLKDRRLGGPKEQLERFFDSDLNPRSKLGATYLPVLDQLIRGLEGGEKEAVITRFKDIVGIIVLLASPLSASSLASLLVIDIENIDNQLDMLHSVLNIPSSPDAPIRLFHLSFRDFLVNKENRATNPFWVDEQGAHKEIMVCCLKLLSANYLRNDICDLRRPATLRSEIEQEKIDAHFPSEMQYACLYWVHHLKESGRTIRDHDQVHHFLIDHLLHWIEALSLLGRISESIGMFDSLLGMIDSEDSVEISAMIRDAKRLILINRSSINETPLQIYSSALLFAPEKSVIRNIFRDQFPSWISLLPQVENDWDACLATLEGHTEKARTVSFSPDGRHLASSSADGTVKLWDTATGRCTATFVSNAGYNGTVCFSPDSRQLESPLNNQIKLWNSITGCCITTFEGHNAAVTDISFASDGRQLASASEDHTVKLWDTETGDCIRTFEGHDEEVEIVSFAPDNRQLASVSNELGVEYTGIYIGLIKLWNTELGSCTATLTGHNDRINAIAFTPDSRRLASASEDSTVKLWDTAIGSYIITLKGHKKWVEAISFTPDGRQLASASADATVKLWDMNTAAIGSCIATFTGHNHWVIAIAFTPDGQQLASASADKTVKLWDTATGRCITTFTGHQYSVTAISLTPDGRQLASASEDHTVKLWDITISHSLSTTDSHNETITDLSFTADGRQLASASQDQTVRLWDAATGRCITTFKGHETSVHAISFAPDGRHLASLSVSGTLRLWDITTGHCSTTLQNDDDILSITFAPNNQQLASVSRDRDAVRYPSGNTIKLWDISTGCCTAILERNDNHSSLIAFSPNSQVLVSTSTGNTTKFWDLLTGSHTATLPGDGGEEVCAVTFSPNGQLLVLTSADDTIKIWDTATYNCIKTLKGHSSQVTATVFAPNGQLVSASHDDTIKCWDITTGSCTATLQGYGSSVKAINFAPDGKIACDLGGKILWSAGEHSWGNYPSLRSPTWKSPIQGPSSASPIAIRRDIGIYNQTWVTWDSHKILWLPPAYRPRMSAVRASTLAIGCDSGRVVFIRFSDMDKLFKIQR